MTMKASKNAIAITSPAILLVGIILNFTQFHISSSLYFFIATEAWFLEYGYLKCYCYNAKDDVFLS
jgi:hypothetical protein